MKISYSNYVPLKYMKENNESFIFYDIDKDHILKNKKEIYDLFINYKNNFNKETVYITKPFINSFNNVSDKITKCANDEINKTGVGFVFQGTYLINNYVLMCYQKYSLIETDITGFLFDRNGVFLSCINYMTSGLRIQEPIKNYFLVESKNNRLLSERIESNTSLIVSIIKTVKDCCFFKVYADVQTKILTKHKKTKFANCKYINDTSIDITYLDSKWFTNLLKTEGFTVRGHFRLQPKKKDGIWIKELIWINDFEKSGYTASAKILNS